MKGNGNACAFVFPDQTLGIVDWGTDDISCIRSLLDKEAPSAIRFVLATHSHVDHTLGLRDVLVECHSRRIRIENFIYPSIGPLKSRPSPLWKAVRFAEQHNVSIIPVSINDFEGMEISQPIPIAASTEWEVVVLAPPASTNSRHEIRSHIGGPNPGNPTSIVLLFRPKDSNHHAGRALLPGDATPRLLQFAKGHESRHPEYHIHNDIIVAPHHGSDHNWPRWLNDYVHGIIVVSSGSNRPSHPGKKFLERVTPHCRRGTDSVLFCTSYNHQCRIAFAHDAPDSHSQLLAVDSPCFGDMEITLDPKGSRANWSDQDGPTRRGFGHCTRDT